MLFRIHRDIDIRARYFTSPTYEPNRRTQPTAFKNYTHNELARDVSFCLDYINSIPDDKPIGIFYGQLTYYHIAFKLALVKSQRPYILFQSNDTEDIRTDLADYCSRIFVLGEWANKWFVNRKLNLIKENQYKFDEFIIDTDTWEFQNLAESHCGSEKLEFDFSDNQQVYFLQSDSDKTEGPWLAYTSGKIEASSIETAMFHYFEESDICIHHRPFKHFGVGTLGIYPALFKSRQHIICTTQEEWVREYHPATNVHLAYQMITSKFPLPKHARIVTTGGYNFDHDCVRYVIDQCSPEKIIDCFGISVCPPPLAIRTLTLENLKTSFTWVNNYFTYRINSSDNLEIIGIDNIFKDTKLAISHNKIRINDNVLAAEDGFYFLGSATLKVRINHQLVHKSQFLSWINTYLKENNIPADIELTYQTGNNVPFPVLSIPAKFQKEIKKFIDENSVEIKLILVD